MTPNILSKRIANQARDFLEIVGVVDESPFVRMNLDQPSGNLPATRRANSQWNSGCSFA